MLRDPPEIASRPTNGSRPTGWEALIYIVPRDDWLVLNVNFCESLIYNVVHYYVGKRKTNGRTHCYAVNLFVEFAIDLESGALADPL